MCIIRERGAAGAVQGEQEIVLVPIRRTVRGRCASEAGVMWSLTALDGQGGAPRGGGLLATTRQALARQAQQPRRQQGRCPGDLDRHAISIIVDRPVQIKQQGGCACRLAMQVASCKEVRVTVTDFRQLCV